MKRWSRIILTTVVLLTCLATPQTFSRGKVSGNKTALVTSDTTELADTIFVDYTEWPSTWAVQQTGSINTSFTCYGTLGESNLPGVSDVLQVGFESPPGSGNEYMFWGALWIGGIVGEDTVVSTGLDGWGGDGREFHPPNYPDSGSIYGTDYGDHCFIFARFLDTLVYLSPYDSIHIPLGLDCRLNSKIWRSEYYRDIVFYDLIIKNISSDVIRRAYVGIYADADVFTDYPSGYGTIDSYTDDLAGSFRSEGIAYIIDNDGALDKINAGFDGLRRCLAVKLIASSHEFTDTNFNWWVNGISSVQDDFGPRLRGTEADPFRDFGDGALGTPNGDRNKYYVLSHDEWDYDQVFTSSIQPEDSVWCYPPQRLAANYTDGIDTKFLLSFGPLDLEPDDGVRMIFAMFTGDSIHTIPDNLDYLPENVTKYLSNLDFNDVLINSYRADEIMDSILNPFLPVSGLRVAFQSWDSVVVDWDPWCFDDVKRYERYLSEVPSDSIYHPGLVPPWLQPDSYNGVRPCGKLEESRSTFTDLDPSKFYFFNVAHRVGSQAGDPGQPVFLSMRQQYPAPVTDRLYSLYLAGEAAEFGWKRPDISELDHYNIYRFDSRQDYENRYRPFYDRGRAATRITPVDTFFVSDSTTYFYYALEPFVSVAAGETTFTVTSPVEGYYYAVTAVDKYGFESEFSESVTLLETVPRTQDIVVVTLSRIINPIFTTREWINSFYHEVLDGYDYDIYYYADTMAALEDCWASDAECFEWTDLARYKLAILDEDWRDVALNTVYEERVMPLTKYLMSGGKLAFFGNLAGLNPFFSTLSTSKYYAQDHWFVERFFGIDSIFFYPYNYYSTRTTKPYVDTCFGFVEAVSPSGEYPDLAFDTLGNVLSAFILNYWPSNTVPCVSTFRPNDMGEVTHLYRARYPQTSRLDGHPVGIHTVTSEAETYLFGFHLWSTERAQARLLIDQMFGSYPATAVSSPSMELPDKFNLRQNYPNPFNPSTVIVFDLPRSSSVSLEIHNVLGQKVRTLVADRNLPAGTHTVEWDGNDGNGSRVASGVYFYTLTAGANSAHRKMLLLK